MKNLKSRLITAFLALVVCVVIGCVIASIVGIPLWMGAVGMVAVGVGMSFVRLPNGLRAGEIGRASCRERVLRLV